MTEDGDNLIIISDVRDRVTPNGPEPYKPIYTDIDIHDKNSNQGLQTTARYFLDCLEGRITK